MDRLWAILVREYVERVRTRWFAIATVFGPLLLGGLIFLPPWLASRSTAAPDIARITILDGTGTELGTRVAAELNGGVMGDTSLTQVQVVAPQAMAQAESLAVRDVIAGRRKGYLVLERRTLSGRGARYAGTNATAAADMEAMRRILRDEVLALRLEQLGVQNAATRELARMRVTLASERLTRRGRGGSGQMNVIFAIGVAFLLYMSIAFYGQNVLRGVMEEKQTRVAEVVVSSVSPTKLLAGKVLGVGAVGLTQIVIWTLTSVALIKARGPILARMGADVAPMPLPSISTPDAIALVLFFVLGYTVYAALFAAVGAMVNSEQEAQQAQWPIMLLLISSVFFLQPILQNPDGTLARVMGALPFTAPIVMPLRMSVAPVAPVDVVLSLISVVAGCYVAIWLAARIYRVGLLMYGKRPSLGELGRWVRHAN
ncbi:MAG TPA: ABC transporter permease [Gemmatimonadaceae bacterium]|nr:ABC transporter permease [Gemmatimonadaceae bacterium]